MMAPIGLKLWENAFQVIPDISLFDANKHFLRQICLSQKIVRQYPENVFSKVPILEELCRFGRHWQMRLENSLPEL